MALFPQPLDAIFSAINTQNGVVLVESEYDIGTPTPWTDPAGVTNTQITITANDSGDSPYTGAVTVAYSRLDLASLATLLPMPLYFNGLVTTLDVAALMNTLYGLNFNGDSDIEEADIVYGENNAGTVTLTAVSTSLGWIGSVTIPFQQGNFNLASEITVTQLPGLLYPDQTVTPTMPFGELYSYWRDFSAQSTDLAAMTSENFPLATLATDLQTNTGDAWTATAASRFSVEGATFVYNGTVADCPAWNNGNSTPNPAYLNVLLVQLNPTYSLGYSGYLVLHYGDLNSDFGS